MNAEIDGSEFTINASALWLAYVYEAAKAPFPGGQDHFGVSVKVEDIEGLDTTADRLAPGLRYSARANQSHVWARSRVRPPVEWYGAGMQMVTNKLAELKAENRNADRIFLDGWCSAFQIVVKPFEYDHPRRRGVGLALVKLRVWH